MEGPLSSSVYKDRKKKVQKGLKLKLEHTEVKQYYESKEAMYQDPIQWRECKHDALENHYNDRIE